MWVQFLIQDFLHSFLPLKDKGLFQKHSEKNCYDIFMCIW